MIRVRKPYYLKGLTLIELIVASSIATVLGAGLLYTMIQGNEVFAGINLGQQRTSSLVEAYNRIYSSVRLAVEFPDSAVIDGVTYTTNETTLVMKLYSVNAAGELECDGTSGPIPTDTLVYTTEGQDVVEISDPNVASARPKSNRVVFEDYSTLSFDQHRNGVGQNRIVTLELGRVNKGVERKLTQEMVARND